MLGQHGYTAHIFDHRRQVGGMCRLIPPQRLDRRMLDDDVRFDLSMSNVAFRKGRVDDAAGFMERSIALAPEAALYRRAQRASKDLRIVEQQRAVGEPERPLGVCRAAAPGEAAVEDQA